MRTLTAYTRKSSSLMQAEKDIGTRIHPDSLGIELVPCNILCLQIALINSSVSFTFSKRTIYLRYLSISVCSCPSSHWLLFFPSLFLKLSPVPLTSSEFLQTSVFSRSFYYLENRKVPCLFPSQVNKHLSKSLGPVEQINFDLKMLFFSQGGH